MLSSCFKIFGPVLVVSKFKTEEEALRIANDTTYGLGAAVFTGTLPSFGAFFIQDLTLNSPSDFIGDAKQAMRVSADLQAGSVWVNQYGILHSSVPFGGYKSSGTGRELGGAGIHEYMNVSFLSTSPSRA